MTFTLNVWLTSILYSDAVPGYDQNCLQVQYEDSYHKYHICPPTLSFGDAVNQDALRPTCFLDSKIKEVVNQV